MRSFLQGLRDYRRAGRIILEQRLWVYLLVPGLLGLLYFPVALLVGFQFVGPFSAHLHEEWMPDWMQYAWIAAVVSVLLWLAAGFLGFVVFRNVVMIFYSPVLGIVSERTERAAFPRADHGPGLSFWRGMMRGVAVSVLSLVLSLGTGVLAWLLVWVPLVGALLSAVALPATQMFFAGHGFFDPALERHHFGVRGGFRFAWRHRGRLLGCGAGFVLLTLVPVIGWFIAPGLGIVAGTLSAVELLQEPPVVAEEKQG